MSNQIIASKISEVAGLLRTRACTATELCDFLLERISKTSQLNAFITVTDRLAREQARGADERFTNGKQLSLLDGIPIAIKDNFCTNGVRTTCASRMLQDYVPNYNATVVEKLTSAGAVMVGKTNLDEYAMGSATFESHFGPSINPWKFEFSTSSSKSNDDPAICEKDWYLAGGSSGGSAIAVATGTAFAALGTDTGGSTRHPAALVGVCGMKPSYGTLSRKGMIPLTHSMDTPGIMAKYVSDVSLILNELSGFDPKDSTSLSQEVAAAGVCCSTGIRELDLTKITIGVPEEYNLEGMSSEVKTLWSETCDRFSALGAKVVNVSLPHTKYSLSSYAVLKACDVASNFSCYDGVEFGHRASLEKAEFASLEDMYSASRTEGFNDSVKGFILAGNYFLLKDNYHDYYEHATKVRRLVCDDFYGVFNNSKERKANVDILLTPVTLKDAPTYAEWSHKDHREVLAREDFFTQPANMAGLPAISVPCKLSEKGLPLSLQVIGPYLKDNLVLSVAQVLETMSQFPFFKLDK